MAVTYVMPGNGHVHPIKILRGQRRLYVDGVILCMAECVSSFFDIA